MVTRAAMVVTRVSARVVGNSRGEETRLRRQVVSPVGGGGGTAMVPMMMIEGSDRAVKFLPQHFLVSKWDWDAQNFPEY